MSGIFFLFVFLLLFFQGPDDFSATAASFTPPSQLLKETVYKLNIVGSYWQSSDHYDGDGNETGLSEGEDYTQIDGDFTLSYGLSNFVEFRVGGKYRLVAATANASASELTASGFESALIGGKVGFQRSGRAQYAIDAFYRIGTYENKTPAAGNEVVLGDEGQEVAIGGLLSYYRTLGHVFSSALYYVAPGNELSEELRWQVESTWIGGRWGLSLGVLGVKSLEGDDFTDDPTQKPTQDTVASGLYNSINRELLAPYGGISYSHNSWRLELAYKQVIRGISTDGGAQISLGLTWISKSKKKKLGPDSQFKEYGLEATVVKVSPKSTFLKIDKGPSQGVEKGMKFDVFKTNYFGGNILVASGFVLKVHGDTAIIKITRMHKKMKIDNGFIARSK